MKAEILWTVNESWDKQGTVISYSIDRRSGNLQKIEEISSEGSGPCFVDYHQKSDIVVVANYGSGNITAIPTNGKGKQTGNLQYTYILATVLILTGNKNPMLIVRKLILMVSIFIPAIWELMRFTFT
jgi:hypothetical protein